MNIITTAVTIDLYRQNPWIEIDAKQYDDKSRHLLINLTSNGEPYTIPSGTTIRFQGTKNDGTQVMRDCPVPVNNKINVELTQQVLTAAGPMRCEIFLADSTGELRSTDFVLNIQQAALQRSDITSSNEYQSIDKIKVDTLQYKNDAEAAKTAAEAAKNAAAGSAATATQQAQTAQIEAQKVQKIIAGNEAYTKTESDLKYAVAPRKEASSDSGELKLTDADDGLSYLELQGNSEQYTNTASINLFDIGYQTSMGMVKMNKYINASGEIIVQSGWSYTYYIKVKPSTKYSVRNLVASTAAAIVYYNKDKVYLSGMTTTSAVIDNIRAFITPTSTEWIRISFPDPYSEAFELYEGSLQPSITGAVETPSPEYPSEVQSVGDIPKDVNGVEIRNLLDEEWIKGLRESDFTKSANGRVYSIDVSERIPKSYLLAKGFLVGNKVNIQVFLSDTPGNGSAGHSAIFVGSNGIPTSSGYDASKYDTMVLNFYVESITFDMVIAAIKNYKFMLTPAAEIDEYRPYIGENNGLVKLESIGKNLFNPQELYNLKQESVAINCDTIVIDNVSGFFNKKVTQDKFKENTQYTLSVYWKRTEKTSTASNFRFNIVYTDGTIKEAMRINSSDYVFNKFTSQIGKTIDYITCDYGTSEVIVYMKKLQLEEGEMSTDYQPYHQQITWIPLKEPLMKMPGTPRYIDQIDKNGNVKVMTAKRHFKDLKVNAVKPSYGYNDNTYFTVTFVGGSYSNTYDPSKGLGSYPNQDFTSGIALSQMFKQYSVYAARESVLIPGLVSDPHYVSLTLRYDRIGLTSSATGDEIKAKLSQWLIDNDPVVYLGIFDGSQFIDLYKYQIPAIHVETYDTETHIRCLNKVTPAMEVDYKIALSSLIKRLEALEANIVQEV